MPEYRPEFAQYINRLTGPVTDEQAGIRTGLSGEYVRKMRRHGLVPSLQIVEQIAAVYHADLNEARIAAGYDPILLEFLNLQPGDMIAVLTKNPDQLSQDDRDKIIEFAEQLLQEAQAQKVG